MPRKLTPSHAEAAAELEARFAKTEKVAEAILEQVGNAYGSGSLPCPLEGCPGTVSYAVVYSSRNKNKQAIRARCSGADCVSFME